MVAGGGPGCAEAPPPEEWQFLQCFGERTPGEEVQDGEDCLLRMTEQAAGCRWPVWHLLHASDA